jgi:CRP-like cAMP-binding protein
LDTAATPKVNRLLAALPAAAYQRLLPDLEAITLRTGATLFGEAERLRWAYFPTESIVTLSYAIEENGRMAKAWPVGREGVVDISLFLGGLKRYNRADVQIGGHAFRLPASALLREFRRAGALQRLLLRYAFALVTQASQLGVCSNYHPTKQRLCRFLLRLFDRVSDGEVAITQERIGELLGVRRVSISRAAGKLQAAGSIEYVRGRVKLISRRKLAERACACSQIIERAFEEMLE